MKRRLEKYFFHDVRILVKNCLPDKSRDQLPSIEGAAQTTYLRTDDAALLTLAFDSDVKAATAVTHLERVWGSCRSELA